MPNQLLRRGTLLLIIALLAACAPAPAAVPTPFHSEKAEANPASVDWGKTPRFENISIEQGLSQSTPLAFLQDRTGFIWIATQDGLNRFDGSRFVVYKNDPDDPASLSNNYVQALYEDPAGYLWIATLGGGLNRFDPRTATFTRYQPDPADPASLSHPAVSSIAAAPDGSLWLGTNGGGLNHFDPAAGTFTAYHHRDDDPASLGDEIVLKVAAAADGTIWAATQAAGLDRLDPATGKFTTYRSEPDDPTSIGDDAVQALWIDHRGRVWAGGGTGGLSLFDGRRFIRFRHDPADPFSLGDDTIQAIFEDRDGTIWVGTAQGGLDRFDESTGWFHHYRTDPLDRTTLSNNSIISLYQDRAGVYWIGTSGSGFDRFDPARMKFAGVSGSTQPGEGLLGSVVWAILKDESGDLWVGTTDGLTRFGKAGLQQYVNDPNDSDSLPSNAVYAISEDARGTIWVGTGAGLCRYNPASDDFTTFGSAPVLSLLVDRQGPVWFGTIANGLARLDPGTGSITSYSTDPADPRGMGDNSATRLYEDRSGTLWVGTFASGLCRFDRGSETFSCYRHNPRDPASLSHYTILDILEDHQGRLWVATGGGGLDLFNPEEGNFRAYRQKDGLPNDMVYSILEDAQGQLWLSTNRGLARYDPQAGTFKVYTTRDGLQSDEFNMGARFQSPDGEMYFGGIHGFNSFRPEDIRENPYLPPVVITGFSLFNEPVSVAPHSLLTASLQETPAITLRYNQDFFSFDFAALHYSAPESIQYAYMMEGLDTGWNYIGNRRYAGYTKVPPGEYTFRVKATNSDGVWNEAGTAMHVSVVPPFWQTWWFRLLALGLLGGALFGAFELRLRMERLQKRELERQVQARTHELHQAMSELKTAKDAAEAASRAKSAFLANVSHELRTPLNAILGFSQMLLRSARPGNQERANLSAEQLEDVQIIHESGEHLLGLINDVLEISKIEAGRAVLREGNFDLLRLLEGLEDMFRYRAAEKDLTLEAVLAADLPRSVRADEGKLRQVLMNLLGNAVKFTEQGGLLVRVQATRGSVPGSPPGLVRLRFSVTDTGPGISPDELAGLFRPFTQASSAQKAQEGTGLGLSISRQYAELMGGSLSATSQPGDGSTFVLEVPVQEVEAAEVASIQARRVVGLAPGQLGLRILVVDDKPFNRAILVRLLAPLGFELREAENGWAALEIWEGWEPRAILMDMRMPVMDGYETARRIKSTTRGQATVIIAVTASALEEERAVILSEGCDDYIRKPFREQEIFDALERHLGVQFLYESLEPAAPAHRVEWSDAALADRLAEIPPEILAALRSAVTLGDVAGITGCIEAVRSLSAPLANALADLAGGYEFEKILRMLDSDDIREASLPPHPDA